MRIITGRLWMIWTKSRITDRKAGMDMEIKSTRFTSIEQVTQRYLNHDSSGSDDKAVTSSFGDILKDKVLEKNRSDTGLKFSKHAAQRLSDRNIDLTSEQLDRLNKGARLSSDKGIKESLVLMDDYAFIVNTGNNTVITAMEKNNEENVYTNIDGAVLV